MIKNCMICGNTFKMYQKTGYNYIGKTCSRPCFFRTRQLAITKECASCGKELKVKPYRVNQTISGIFCCNKFCRSKHKREYPEKYAKRNIEAINVGNIIKDYEQSKFKIYDIARKYDISKHAVRNILKAKNISIRRYQDYFAFIDPKSFTALAKRVLKERGNSCQKCSWNEAKCDVHHIIPRSKGGLNERKNLIILCPNCHRLVHYHKLKI